MIKIVFVEPENPGNIGALARVMKNFDFKKLVLVNPQCDYPFSLSLPFARSKFSSIFFM